MDAPGDKRWMGGRILVTDRLRSPQPLAAFLERAVPAAGAGAVWLREKDLDPSALLELGTEVAGVLRVPLLLSGPGWIARRIGAAGIHLPWSRAVQSGGRPERDGLLRGASVHSPGEASAAASLDLDYIVFGPVLDTVKNGAPVPGSGFERLREVCDRAAALPVIAIGGLGFEHERAVLASGARAWAAIRCFLESATR